jgi:hypothetical protein
MKFSKELAHSGAATFTIGTFAMGSIWQTPEGILKKIQ